jgi:hypothetical protein
VNEAHIQALVKVEGDLPPILVHRSTMRVIDGMHRLGAARLSGEPTIEVEFFDGSQDAAFLLSVEANITHGLPLSLEDRRAAARIISMAPQMSDREIARRTRLAHGTVAGIRGSQVLERMPSEVRIGGDGRKRPVNGREGRRRRVTEAITANPSASLRQIAKVAGVSVGTAHAVKARMALGEDSETTRLPRQHGTVPGSNQDLLMSVQQDPALRFSDTGRELLRLLRAHDMTESTAKQMVEVVPPHLMPAVAEMARRYAACWTEFAHSLQERWRQES